MLANTWCRNWNIWFPSISISLVFIQPRCILRSYRWGLLSSTLCQELLRFDRLIIYLWNWFYHTCICFNIKPYSCIISCVPTVNSLFNFVPIQLLKLYGLGFSPQEWSITCSIVLLLFCIFFTCLLSSRLIFILIFTFWRWGNMFTACWFCNSLLLSFCR